MEKDMKQAAYAEMDRIGSHETPYRGTVDELEVYEPDDMVRMFQKGVEWALAMLWHDPSELPKNCKELLIDDGLGNLHRCEKRGDYVEDLDDGIPLINDEISQFISAETLKKTLDEGFSDKAR